MLGRTNNIVVLGVGHSGTSIVTKMLGALGWNLGETVPGFVENAVVQNINKRLLSQQSICYCGWDEFRQGVCTKCNKPLVVESVASYEYRQALDLPKPWAVKDPRLVLTFEAWKKHFIGRNVLLLHLEKDPVRMKKTYERYGFKSFRIYGHHVSELIDTARQHFHEWPCAKVSIIYEDIRDAIQLFNTQRT